MIDTKTNVILKPGEIVKATDQYTYTLAFGFHFPAESFRIGKPMPNNPCDANTYFRKKSSL